MRENLRAEDVTVAELLRGAGYETACIGKWGLGPKGMSGYPLNQGFDYFMGYDTHKSAHNYYPKTLCENNVERELPGNKTEPKMQYSHDVFAKKAMGFVQRKHEKPYFLYLNYTIPHSPYDPPDIKPYGNKAWSSTKKKYAAMITRMDRDIGELIEQVKLSDENTLIIFASDNGPQSGGRTENDITSFFNSNGDMRGIKRDVYNGGVRVPFIAWWPGKVKPGTVNAHISGFQDFLPTVCELAGIQTDVQTDGISYLPTLLGQKGKQRDHEWMYWEFLWMPQDEKNISGRQAVLSPKLGFKAVRYGRKSPVELYKFESDTGEDSDVAKKFPEVANKMSRYLDRCRGKSDLWPIRFHDKPFISTFSPNYKKKGK
jgi:arylsulfatase A-like enzyme